MQLNKIYNENCLDTMSKIPDNYVNLIVTSPPYNKNFYTKNNTISKNKLSFSKIKYDTYNDDLQPEVYISWQKKVLKECCRILKDDGSIFYNHMDILNNHLTIHPSFVYDFNIKQILIWNRSNTPKLDNNYFYPINEWIFWIKKNKQSKTKFFRKKCVFQKSIISLKPNVKNNHPAPFPLQLANNFILSCTDKNDIVYDPFIGSGTTAIASIINNRNYIGSEISKNYVNIANKRIKPYLTQTKLF
jgi:site-specific DNA-methyltransferase (adenine-specific)